MGLGYNMSKEKSIIILIVFVPVVVFLTLSRSTTGYLSDYDLGAFATIPIENAGQSSQFSISPALKFSHYFEDDSTHTIHFYEYGSITPVFSNGFSAISTSSFMGVALDLHLPNSELMIGPALGVSYTFHFNPFSSSFGFGITLFADYKYFFNDRLFLNAQLELPNLRIPIIKSFIGVGIRKKRTL